MEDEYDWDFWEIAKLNCSGYDSKTDQDLIMVFVCSSNPEIAWYENTAKKLNLDPAYVNLLKEILCNADFCEYGTSPRSSWAIHNQYDINLNKLKEWYFNKWGEAVNLNSPSQT